MSGEPPPVPGAPDPDPDHGVDPGHEATPLTPPGAPVDRPRILPSGPPVPPPPGAQAGNPYGASAVNPYGAPPVSPYRAPERPRLQWPLVVVGIPLGFVAWVVGSFAVLAVSGTLANTGAGSAVALAVLVLGFLAAVGLVVWPRTRRLGQGFVLGAAIGLIVGGGLCIPLVSTF